MDLPDLIPLQQSSRYVATLRLMGRQVIDLAPDGDTPLYALRRRFGPVPLYYLPRADLGDGRAKWLSALPRRAARLVIPEVPDQTAGDTPGFPILTAQHIAELNVPRPPVMDHIWANMHGKWRNRLRRAQDSALVVRETLYDPDRDAALLRPELRQRRRRGYRSYTPAFLAAYATANPHQTCLLQARLNGDTIAFMLFLLHGPVATYTTGWTGSEGRKTHAHNLLMFEAMKRLFIKGICRIDLGTIDTDDGMALARFKLGCGARARTLGATRLIPPGFRVSP
ncbi:GNAT family N-acetyltransferase [Pseudooceanicola sp. MF1-13]|uniref:GNAT family N-acetyltransferase n=1 Tax=Pseudooceanicola sp. MF1-13 TaxID=3379095 RepID=UPI00389223F1